MQRVYGPYTARTHARIVRFRRMVKFLRYARLCKLSGYGLGRGPNTMLTEAAYSDAPCTRRLVSRETPMAD